MCEHMYRVRVSIDGRAQLWSIWAESEAAAIAHASGMLEDYWPAASVKVIGLEPETEMDVT